MYKSKISRFVFLVFLIYFHLNIFNLIDHSFAILTFDSILSVDQCLIKRDEIKKKYRLTVKRNLRETTREQRSCSEFILIHIEDFGLYLLI